MEFPTPRKLKITTLFLGADQWVAARRIGRMRGWGKRGGAQVVRQALDEYLGRASKSAPEVAGSSQLMEKIPEAAPSRWVRQK
jgi:hypothetical protein